MNPLDVSPAPVLERVYRDPRTGYRAVVVIDTLVGGRANGGVRIRPGLTPEELRIAARVMTWKYRFVGIPHGGAKAGIEGPEDLPRVEKARRLAWFAEAAHDLIDTGVLGIGPDMGTDPGLIRELLEQRGLLRGRRPFPSRFRGSGYYTALTVVQALGAALASRGRGFEGISLAIEGFGAVGSNVARLLAARGARVIAISTREGCLHRSEGLDVDRLLAVADPLPADPSARRSPAEELLELPVDALLPCGPGGTLDEAQAGRIRAGLVVPGANAPFLGDAEAALHRRGVLVVPSFVANCGGVTAAALGVAGVPEWAIERLLCGIYPRRVAELLGRAARSGRSPAEAALAALLPLPGAGVPSSDGARWREWVRGLLRSPWIPGWLWAGPTYAYFARRLGRLRSETPATRP